MSLAAMIEDGFPHGTVEGFRAGCKGSICPAAKDGLSCERFTTRWNGDYGFRKQILAGVTVQDILAAEKAAVESRPARVDMRRKVAAEEKRALIRKLNAKGWTDTRIAAHIGQSFSYVSRERRTMGLPLFPSRKGPAPGAKRESKPGAKRRARLEHGTVSMYTSGRCRKGDPCPVSPSCLEVAVEYKRNWRRTKATA